MKLHVYLHGFASAPSSRKAQFFRERYAEHGTPLEIPELDEGDFQNLTISSQLAVIEKLINGRPAVLIGSSMGGYLAALYASKHPEVEKLLLLAPAFYFPQRWPLSLGPEKVAAWEQTGTMEFYHY